jgi:hypothetical protein
MSGEIGRCLVLLGEVCGEGILKWKENGSIFLACLSGPIDGRAGRSSRVLKALLLANTFLKPARIDHSGRSV